MRGHCVFVLFVSACTADAEMLGLDRSEPPTADAGFVDAGAPPADGGVAAPKCELARHNLSQRIIYDDVGLTTIAQHDVIVTDDAVFIAWADGLGIHLVETSHDGELRSEQVLDDRIRHQPRLFLRNGRPHVVYLDQGLASTAASELWIASENERTMIASSTNQIAFAVGRDAAGGQHPPLVWTTKGRNTTGTLDLGDGSRPRGVHPDIEWSDTLHLYEAPDGPIVVGWQRDINAYAVQRFDRLDTPTTFVPGQLGELLGAVGVAADEGGVPHLIWSETTNRLADIYVTSLDDPQARRLLQRHAGIFFGHDVSTMQTPNGPFVAWADFRRSYVDANFYAERDIVLATLDVTRRTLDAPSDIVLVSDDEDLRMPKIAPLPGDRFVVAYIRGSSTALDVSFGEIGGCPTTEDHQFQRN